MKTTDDFRKELYAKFGERLIIPEDAIYLGSKKDIKVICPKHGVKWMKPNNLLNGSKCRDCGYEDVSAKNSDSIDTFLNKAYSKHGDKYEYPLIKEEYGTVEKIHILCKTCGNIFVQKPAMHIFGNGCPHCHKFPKKYTKQSLQESIRAKHPLIDLVSEYKGDNDSEIIVKCKKHNVTWKTTSHRLSQQKYGCNLCYHEHRLKEIRERQAKNFQGFIEKHYKPLYDISQVKYVNEYTNVKLICPKHGEFHLKPSKMLSRLDGCPYCHESHLERETSLALNKFSLKYEREKTFDWLKSKSNLFLDFYIKEYNVAIECQGEQHIIERDESLLNKTDKFKDKIYRDKLKNILCTNHNIRIVYILSKMHSSYCLNEQFNHMYDDALFIEDIQENPQILIDKINEAH